MSLHHHQFVRTTLFLLAVTMCTTARAQHSGSAADYTNLYDPFCEVDTDWFEPIDCGCLDERPLNSGWFFSYQRSLLWATRPNDGSQRSILNVEPQDGVDLNEELPLISDIVPQSGNGNDADQTHGNLFEFGFQSEAGDGFFMTLRKIDNPGARFLKSNTNLDEDVILSFDGNEIGTTFVTLNGLRIYSGDLNKIWRLPPTYRGVILEPFVGLRYTRIRDHFDRREWFQNIPDFNQPGTPNTTLTFENRDYLRLNETTTDNDLFGGQLGMRSRMRRGRWVMMSDVRGLLFHNFRDRENISRLAGDFDTVTVTYDAAGNGTAAITGDGPLREEVDIEYDDSNNFVYGGQLRLEVAFELTKAFSIRGGGEILAFGDGIGRGNVSTDESLVLGGLNLGFALNR